MKSLALLSLYYLFVNVFSYNYLIWNPMLGYSQAMYFSRLADVIADAGHNVTVFQHHHSYVRNTDGLIKNKNIEIINYYPDNYEQMKLEKGQTFPEMWDSMLMTNPVLGAFMMPSALVKEIGPMATWVLTNKDIRNQLKNKKFDAILAETFETSGFYMAHLIGVPVIACFSTVHCPAQTLFGQPSNIGYVPGDGSSLPPNAGFLDRLNDVYQEYFYNLLNNRLYKQQHVLYTSVIDETIPHWTQLISKSPIFILNSNPLLDFAVANPGNMIQIGGITVNKEKVKKVETLPEEYERILKERESTVLISFGSVVRSFEMPESYKSGIIEMFHNLPDVTFIWKYEKDDDELEKRLPNNVHLKKWVPQPALLADGRLDVFMTHGGLSSTMEVAYSGTPAFMVPLFYDQPTNAMMLARHGGAVSYNKYELKNGDKMTKVMKDMVNNPKYKENAKKLQNTLMNQPIDPKHTLISHLEFATKFPNHQSQVPEISQAGFIGFYYLDVLAFFSIIIFSCLYLIYRVTRSMLFSRKSKSE